MLAHSPSIVLNGLVLCLDAGNIKSYNSSTSLTAWNDLSGKSNNGTLENGPTYSSLNNGTLYFDGTNDYAFAAELINPNSQFFTSYSQQITIECWVYVPSTSTFMSSGNPTGIVMRGAGAGSHGLRSTGVDNQVSAYFLKLDNSAFCQTTGNITKNSWHQINAIWTGSSAVLYINGSFSSSSSTPTITGDTNYNSSPFHIGRQFGSSNYYNGYISGVKIYNRALSAAEISQNFNALRGRFGI